MKGKNKRKTIEKETEEEMKKKLWDRKSLVNVVGQQRKLINTRKINAQKK